MEIKKNRILPGISIPDSSFQLYWNPFFVALRFVSENDTIT